MKVRKVMDEFGAFALRGNVLDFVMAVVIGGAIGRIITACVNGLVMPTFAYWLRETQWEKWTYWKWRIGPVLSAVFDFLAKAAVMYIFIIKGVGALQKRNNLEASEAGFRTCPYCREPIHPEAIRCRWCGSDVPATPPPSLPKARSG
jgi:large conductance mechanosensitive channel